MANELAFTVNEVDGAFTIDLNGEVSDPDVGDSLLVTWSWTVNGTFAFGSSVATWTPDSIALGGYACHAFLGLRQCLFRLRNLRIEGLGQ